MADEVVVLVTCPASEAERIASSIVEEGLAACVNIVPGLLSIYPWEGKVCKDSESLMVMKSSKNLWNDLEQRIKQLHTYDLPEIICLPIELGHKPYLDWLNGQLVNPLQAASTKATTSKEIEVG